MATTTARSKTANTPTAYAKPRITPSAALIVQAFRHISKTILLFALTSVLAFGADSESDDMRDSYVRIEARVDKQQNRNLFTSLDWAARDDLHLMFSYGRSFPTEKPAQNTSRYFSIGIEKNSLETIPYGVDIGLTQFNSLVSSQSVTPQVSYFSDNWQLRVSPAIQFFEVNLPEYKRRIPFYSFGLQLGGSIFVGEHWMLHINGGASRYPTRLTELQNRIDVRYFVNAPVANFLTGLEKSFVSTGTTYFSGPVSVSLDISVLSSLLDNSLMTKSSIDCSYRWQNAFSTGIRIYRQTIEKSSVPGAGINFSYAW